MSTPQTTTFPPPAGFGDDAELPSREIPDLHLWSENYCFTAYDATTRTGLWLHLGRTPYDPRLWRELVTVYLPSGDFAVTKGYFRSDNPSGPAGPGLRFDCVQPWNRWRATFDGAAVTETPANLTANLMSDGRHAPLTFDIDYQALSPVFEMGEEMQKQSWGHVHYEQLCTVRGPIRYSDQIIDFDGVGIRDHTRGPRDMNGVDRHVWLHGIFPSGKAFVVLDFKSIGHRLTRAAILDGTDMRAARVLNSPLLTDQARAQDPYQIVLDDNGTQTTIQAEILHDLTFALVPENEITIGVRKDLATHWLLEGQSRFTWDGETGYGLSERTLPI